MNSKILPLPLDSESPGAYEDAGAPASRGTGLSAKIGEDPGSAKTLAPFYGVKVFVKLESSTLISTALDRYSNVTG
jgi:hypothetical protein